MQVSVQKDQNALRVTISIWRPINDDLTNPHESEIVMPVLSAQQCGTRRRSFERQKVTSCKFVFKICQLLSLFYTAVPARRWSVDVYFNHTLRAKTDGRLIEVLCWQMLPLICKISTDHSGFISKIYKFHDVVFIFRKVSQKIGSSVDPVNRTL
jgi:hypothetical protein